MPQVLPLVPSVFHSRIGTTIDGVAYVLDVRWNGRDSAWYVDLLAEDETPIRSGIKVVLGALLGGRVVDDRFPFGAIVASDLSNAARDAGIDDLGARVHVYHFTLDELDALEEAAQAAAAVEEEDLPPVVAEGQAFLFTWPADGDTAEVTIPIETNGDYVVTYSFEDLATGDAVTILTFPVSGRTASTFDVVAAADLLEGTTVGFYVVEK